MKALRVLRRVLHLPRTADEASSGQAIFLIAISAMALIAIMGLAIDGGRLLFLSRETQNAADAAAIAAARAMCRDDANYLNIGLATARANGFDNEDEDVEVQVNVPPTRAAHDKAGTEDCIGCFVEVIVTGRIPASFLGVVYDGPLAATSYAVGACNPNYGSASLSDDELPGLRAAFNISPDTQCTLKRTGSTMDVIGGMHANGTLMVNATGQIIGPVSYYGNNLENANNPQYCPPEDCGEAYNDLIGGGSGDSTTAAGICKGTCFETADGGGGGGGVGDPSSYPASNPFQVGSPIADPLGYNIDHYKPGGAKAIEAATTGNYYSYISPTNGNCNNGVEAWLNSKKTGDTFKSALYYTNCDIKMNVGSFNNAKGNITFVTTGTMHLSGDQLELYPFMDDLLLFANGGGNNCPAGHAIQVSGNQARYNGNLYAPNGEIKFSASSSIANSCMVGWGVDLSGAGSTINCMAGIPDSSGAGEPAIYLPE